jgi:hypothetical protein
MEVAVITATTGRESLYETCRSVLQQGESFRHYVVVDGIPGAANNLKELRHHPRVTVLELPCNVGSDQWNGHRIYAAMPFLVDPKCGYVAFLDDDNVYIGGSLRQMYTLCTGKGLDWTFCLRRVTDGTQVVEDTCESLGPVDRDQRIGDYMLIDVNCYLIRRRVACMLGQCWNRPYKLTHTEIDREICKYLVTEWPMYERLDTGPGVLYSTGSVPGVSVSLDFFRQVVPEAASKKIMYVFHFSAAATRLYMEQPVRGRRSHSPAYKEWCLTLLDGLASTWELRDGYAQEVIPTGSVCLFCVCQPSELPDSVLLRRDITRIGYLFESPNIRHQQQNDAGFLMERFDTVMTYWQDLIEILPTDRVIPCPQFCHCLELSDPWDRALLQVNEEPAEKASVAIVLENRDLKGQYVINETMLQCHDHLRKPLAQSFAQAGIPVFGYGSSWTGVPAVTQGSEGRWGRQAGHNIMLLKNHTFSLIVENCDARGYVSEKILDALVAGCIPLYYGNLEKAQILVPQDMYIDLKSIEDAPAVIKSLSTEDIFGLKKLIMERREAVLKQNEPQAFASLVEKAVHLARLPRQTSTTVLARVPPRVNVKLPDTVGLELGAVVDSFKSKKDWVGASMLSFGKVPFRLVSPDSIGMDKSLWNFFIKQYNIRFRETWTYRDLQERGIPNPPDRSFSCTASAFNSFMPFLIEMVLVKFDGGKTMDDLVAWVVLGICVSLT